MDEIKEFLLLPYQEALALDIGLEVVAAFLGVLSVFYARAENIRVYPTGIISTGIYVYLLAQWNMYGDLIINIYYTLMSIYGWYMWSTVTKTDNEPLKISRVSRQIRIKAFGIFLFSAFFVLFVYRYYEIIPSSMGVVDATAYFFHNLFAGDLEKFKLIIPFLDTFTTGIAFVAMWLLANKKIENWIFWILVNLVSIPLYFIKGFGFTGIQYFVFLILAILGYVEWKKRLKTQKQ